MCTITLAQTANDTTSQSSGEDIINNEMLIYGISLLHINWSIDNGNIEQHCELLLIAVTVIVQYHF